MNPILRNILAVIAGLVVGMVVNGGLISVSGSIIAPPAGADLTTEEGLAAAMHMMEVKHFIIPLLAHALGTLFGAFVAVKLGVNQPMRLAIIIAIIFLAGGIYMVAILPSPMWFNCIDLLLAYFPMAFIGAKMAKR